MKLYTKHRLPRAAAALAYFLLLTVFPGIICLHAFLGLLHLNAADLLLQFEGIIPASSRELIEGYLAYISGQESGPLLFAGLAMIWTTGSAGFRVITDALSDVYDAPPLPRFRGLLIAALAPLGLLLTIYLSVGVIVTGEWLTRWLVARFDLSRGLFVWDYLRFLLLFCVCFLFLLAVTRLAVGRGTKRLPLLAASGVSACALVGASVLFSWFISLSTKYSLVYGSLMSIVVMAVWLYFCGNILFAGNVLVSAWRERKAP
jgi:YihY family inner membrane protein